MHESMLDEPRMIDGKSRTTGWGAGVVCDLK